jgi:small subunit ribosomal protein S33
MVKYYPPESELDIAKIMREHKELGLVNEAERVRLTDLGELKKRGKGPPKKTKNKGELLAFLYYMWAGANRCTRRG